MRTMYWLAAAVLVGAGSLAHAQAPAAPTTQPSAQGPVKKELDAFRTRFLESAPPERVALYQRGIDELRDSGILKSAKQVGDAAPEFALPNPKGETMALRDLRARGPVVVTWYRGGWCPYCNIALKGYQARMADFKAAGAAVVAISPELPDSALSTQEKNALELVVLSDVGNKTARDFGLAYQLPDYIQAQFKGRFDLARFNGDDSGALPLAATYVIDRDGVIRYAFLSADYRERAEPEEVLAAVRSLGKPARP